MKLLGFIAWIVVHIVDRISLFL